MSPLPILPITFYSRPSREIFKDDAKAFPTTQDIFFMVHTEYRSCVSDLFHTGFHTKPDRKHPCNIFLIINTVQLRRIRIYTVKKVPIPFPAPSRGCHLPNSGREYVSLMKPGIFPDISFPSHEFSQNPFESVSVTVRSCVSDPDPDEHGTALILVGWISIRIQEGKNALKNWRKGKKFKIGVLDVLF